MQINIPKMKKTVYCFIAIVFANILLFRFYFTQDIYRIIAFIALLVLVYIIPKFSACLARLIVERYFSNYGIHLENPQQNQSIKLKTTFIAALALLLIGIFHAWGYYTYFQSEKENLSKKGIYTAAVVTDKRLEKRSKNNYDYFIYYSYKYNGKIYFHNCRNNTIEVGDTIIVKFSPDNPDHHLIMDEIF